MLLSNSSKIQFTEDISICRILNGMWQVSGAHGKIDPLRVIPSMFAYVDAGFTTWDLADHYGSAEDFIGEFRHQWATKRGEESLSNLQSFTKWVPRPGQMNRQIVEENINISLHRMRTHSLDLLQFHWWEYTNPNYLEALQHLMDLQQAGKIKHLGLTNFDTKHLQIIVEHGIKIVSNQVQYSLIDRRPLVAMTEFCQQNNIQLLTYGTLAGGLLSEKYLNIREPGLGMLNTASLRKYKNMLDAWGNWSLFQKLLTVLKSIADKYSVTIANIATRYILEKPMVAGVIIGARLGITEHLEDNSRVFNFQLDSQDYAEIEEVLEGSKNLLKLIGDCGDEYRR